MQFRNGGAPMRGVNAAARGRIKCLPTYIVLDTSGSMIPHATMLNTSLDHLFITAVKSPRVSEFANLSIITFNAAAHVVLPMMDIEEVTALPEVICNGGTFYSSAFRLIRDRINHDVPELISAGR